MKNLLVFNFSLFFDESSEWPIGVRPADTSGNVFFNLFSFSDISSVAISKGQNACLGVFVTPVDFIGA